MKNKKVSNIIDFFLSYYPYEFIKWDKVKKEIGKDLTEKYKKENLRL
jgi:hypothetical protein